LTGSGDEPAQAASKITTMASVVKRIGFIDNPSRWWGREPAASRDSIDNHTSGIFKVVNFQI